MYTEIALIANNNNFVFFSSTIVTWYTSLKNSYSSVQHGVYIFFIIHLLQTHLQTHDQHQHHHHLHLRPEPVAAESTTTSGTHTHCHDRRSPPSSTICPRQPTSVASRDHVNVSRSCWCSLSVSSQSKSAHVVTTVCYTSLLLAFTLLALKDVVSRHFNGVSSSLHHRLGGHGRHDGMALLDFFFFRCNGLRRLVDMNGRH